MRNRMTKNNVYTLRYIVILFLFVFPLVKILAAGSQASVIVPPPLVITILGSNPASLIVGATYTDAGATVLDTSVEVVSVTTILNNVNNKLIGTYSVVYRAVDIAGSVATTTRIVNVVAPPKRRTPPSPDNLPQGQGGVIEDISTISPPEQTGEPITLPPQESVLPVKFCFSKNLNPYTSDPDVKKLQLFLNDRGFAATLNGSENNYYGTSTIDAVIAFQEQNIIIPFLPFDLINTSGNFEDSTRKKVNDILGCEVVSSITSSSTIPKVITTIPGINNPTSTETIANILKQIPIKEIQNNNTAQNTGVGNTVKIKIPAVVTNLQDKIATTVSKVSSPSVVEKIVSNLTKIINGILFIYNNAIEELRFIFKF